MTVSKAFSAIAASTALVFTGIAPAMAAPVGPAIAPVLPIEAGELGWSSEKDIAHRDRRWRGNRGYGRGYGRGHHRRHRGRVNGGDVLAGILILGGIAAIASAASKNKRDRRYRDRDYRNDRRYDDRRSDNRYDSRSNRRNMGAMETAINVCANAAEQRAGDKARVSEIRSVARDGAGWRVEGDLTGSDPVRRNGWPGRFCSA